ncbi:MAG: hypothetical protein V7L31_20635 [Nostoc sp.]|uniref:hypothetical protein n=1 Tax=Nostoc sp. TaxID=1180 RepID=UPI002FF3CC22
MTYNLYPWFISKHLSIAKFPIWWGAKTPIIQTRLENTRYRCAIRQSYKIHSVSG